MIAAIKIEGYINGNHKRILALLHQEEEYLKEFYMAIMQDLLEIRNRASRNDAITLISDLNSYRDKLEELKKFISDETLKKQIGDLIKKMNSFAQSYAEDSRRSLFMKTSERVGSFVASMMSGLKELISEDMKAKFRELRNLEEQFA
ncbi:MAG TPA: hypothetical protein VI564_02000 [Candidatus Nanoarchaeia archaeon]|nr:hypothetical protein [Candidatus Nanoarchaeia archaeon]